MAVTNQFYAANTAGLGRVMQDFGLCDTTGAYQYTAKTRMKGFLVILFWSPSSAPSVRAFEAIRSWAADMPTQKWAGLAVADGDHDTLAAFAAEHQTAGITVLVDHEMYQTRNWGVSHLPSVYLIDGKSGRVLSKVIGDDVRRLDATKTMLSDAIDKVVAAEAAAKKAEEDKKAADAAAAAAAAEKPSEPSPAAAAKA